jgi:hypothetical protein
MKILAAHSLRGDIDHLIVLPSDAPPGSMSGGGGQLVTEVEGLDLHLDLTKAEGLEKLVDTIRAQRIDVKASARLRPK